MKSKVQHPNITRMKRKVELESEVKLSKVVNPPRKNKVPLKEELLIQVKELQEKYDALEKKSKIDIETLQTENTALEDANKKFADEVKTLIQNVQNLEAEKESFSKSTENENQFKCYECSFVANEKSLIKQHLYEKHAWQIDQDSDELDMSAGPRFCRKCDYQAEDGYDLDGHFWSEHDDEENTSLSCKFCDENFEDLNDLMKHKKSQHIEKVSLCRNFSTNLYGDKNCWFVHEEEPETLDTYRCNLCESEFNSPPEFLRHRKKYHEQNVPICNKFESGNCIFGSDKCWFKHKKEFEETEHDKIKDGKIENNEASKKIIK